MQFFKLCTFMHASNPKNVSHMSSIFTVIVLFSLFFLLSLKLIAVDHDSAATFRDSYNARRECFANDSKSINFT